jgi:ABC-type oligopeptide transport system ATPase subunit
MSTEVAVPERLIEVKGLGKRYPVRNAFRSASIWAAQDVSFDLFRGETLGIVGESGSGKTTVGRMIAGLLDPSEGEVLLGGRAVHAGGHGPRRAVWRRLQMIFQDPYSSLNPKMTVEETLVEPLRNFGIARGVEAREKAARMLDACGLPARSLERYPAEFSGGQRQRIGIARALVIDPEIVVADEPVSALDVSVQAQIINLLVDLQREFKLTYLFIGHDLAVVKHIADRVAVMKGGRVLELGETDSLFANPREEYTRQLLASSPVPDPLIARRQLYQ